MTPRQIGLTTRALQLAPLNSFYVWCNSDIDFVLNLKRKLERYDITVVGPDWFENPNSRALQGRDVVIDHATRLSEVAFVNIMAARSRSKL